MHSESAILIVEDSDEDFEACAFAFNREGHGGNPLDRCVTGDEALDYLRHSGRFAGRKPNLPCLIMLDLNLPGTDGREVLQEIKRDEALKHTPVVVMTSSRDEADVAACYRAGANSYMVKPIDLTGYVDTFARLRSYWFGTVQLP